MATKIIDAPGSLCSLVSEKWWLDARNIRNKQTIGGREQVIFNPVPVWRAKLSPLVFDKDEARWRAFVASMLGGVRAVRIAPQCFNSICAAKRVFGIESDKTKFPHSDGALFSDGSGYAFPVPQTATTAKIEAYGNSVNLAMTGLQQTLRDGDWISISGRARIVTGAVAEANGSMTIWFEPAVVTSVPAGSSVKMKPTVVMRLVQDDSGAFDRSAGRMPISSAIELVELPEIT